MPLNSIVHSTTYRLAHLPIHHPIYPAVRLFAGPVVCSLVPRIIGIGGIWPEEMELHSYGKGTGIGVFVIFPLLARRHAEAGGDLQRRAGNENRSVRAFSCISFASKGSVKEAREMEWGPAWMGVDMCGKRWWIARFLSFMYTPVFFRLR
ncbi:hypothetical protein HOY80DRAFT_628797 [Tuber brumale]|nr:hypothetical protein HOY80DRAFT_628797 [Tuber brumale]